MKSSGLFLPILAVSMVILSCDRVKPPYEDVNADLTGGRKVLVEDYTGHKCGNCPRASKAIYDLKSLYGDKLIIVAVHAGGFATPFPPNAPYYTYDFRTPEGTQLDTDFGISAAGNPNGLVNRRNINGSYIISSTDWAGQVADVLSSTAVVPVKLTITNSYDDASRTLTTDISSEFFTTIQGTYKLTVYMVEDSIINWQKDYDVLPNDIPDYVHREVLRGSMNGTYGEVISPTIIGNVINTTYTASLGSDWNAKHLSVIAFIYDEATREIIQVEQTPVYP
jgi:hypothetical protein